MLTGKSHYDIWKLVDFREMPEPGSARKKIRFVSDIDKTYLETAFESWTKMAKIAFENATDKRSIAGAPQLLSALRWGDLSKALTKEDREHFPRPLHFISASPPQLRNVLEEKLSMDGVDWSSDTFKNQAYNLRKRRFNLLKQQVVYKSAALLRLMSGEDPEAHWYLIGDNAESDPFIYLGIKLFCEKKLSRDSFIQWLNLAQADPELSSQLWSGLKKNPQGQVRGIFIRNIPGYRFYGESPLTDPITLFDSYLDASLAFYQCGVLTASSLEWILRSFHNLYGISALEICSKITSTIASCPSEDLCQSLQRIAERIAEEADIRLPVDFAHSIKLADLKHWNALGEDDILRLAEKWMEKQRLHKHQ